MSVADLALNFANQTTHIATVRCPKNVLNLGLYFGFIFGFQAAMQGLKEPRMDSTTILKSHFQEYANQYLRATKGGAGTSVTEIKANFETYLRSTGSPITEISSIQMGLLLKPAFIRRVTGKGAHYLVAIVQAS